MIIIPGEKKAIRKAIKKEREKNGPLRREEKHEIIEKVHKKQKRKAIIIAIAATLGISSAVVGPKLLTDGNQEKETRTEAQEKDRNKEFKERLSTKNEKIKDETFRIEDDTKEIEDSEIFNKIVKEYNEKYPDTPISTNNLGIIESVPEFLIVEENEQGEITKYIQNYRTDIMPPEEDQKVIYNGEDYRIDAIYNVVNKTDKTILMSEGIIDNNVVSIDAKSVRIGTTEYLEDNKDFSLEYKSDAEHAEIYSDLKNKLNEIIKENDKNQEER